MIQDIGEGRFKIDYKQTKPTDESRVMIFCQGELLVVQGEMEISFPTMREVDVDRDKCVYLFQLDGEEYFRYCVQDKNQITLADATWQARHFFRKARPKELVLAAVTGLHLDGWYRSNVFCGRCGHELIDDTKERMRRCPECGNMVYPRINPAVIVGVTDGDKILLTKYRGREYKNYALVAGFTEIGESFEETVRREVMEEVGLKVKNIKYYKSQPWGFADNILAGYYCQVDGNPEISMDKQELSVAEWVHRDDIPDFMEDLSLTHEMIAKFAVDKG